MEPFISKHAQAIIGTLSGFDRLVFRGTLRFLAHRAGMISYLWTMGVLLKDFAAFDAASLAILAACRRVFRPEGRLLIMERIVGGPNDGLETKTSDLNMLVSPDGQERTADEFAALLANAGFRMERIIEVTPSMSIVEAAPI